jgi:hypothetical protein
VTEFFSGVDVRRRVVQFPLPDFVTIEEARTSQQAAH